MSYQSLVKEALQYLSEESIILASPEDAQYFRSLVKTKLPPPVIASPPQKQDSIQGPHVKKEELPTQEEPPPLLHLQIMEKIKPEPLSFAPLKSLFKKVFPNVSILDEIPDDTMAKKIANRWKTKNQVAPISILYTHENALLKQIVKAIDIYFGPANLINAEEIEKEKQWDAFLSSDALKLVIACDYSLWQLHGLMTHYKEVPTLQTRTLKDIPLFLLPDLSLYLKDPLLKRSLWKALCKICPSS